MPRLRLLLLAGALFTAIAMLAACGDEDSKTDAAGNAVDLAFVEMMIPHHESAVEMATLARQNGKSSFIKNLADDIVAAQEREISEMEGIQAKLETAGVKKGDLGVPAHMTGMDADMSALEMARPFDRAFIDEMVPHHQGAIEMARAELAKGQNPQLKKLAQAIIDAQTMEIEAMNAERKQKYGAESPAGGVPAADDESKSDSGSMGGMNH